MTGAVAEHCVFGPQYKIKPALLVSSFCHEPEAVALLLAEVKSTETVGPVLIHIITEKGHGYEPAVSASDKMHGVAKYDILTGKQNKPKATVSVYSPPVLYIYG